MMNPKRAKGGKKAEFLGKLIKILEDKNNDEVIKFDKRNRQIIVKDKMQLKDMLSLHFKHSNFESFTRQLNWLGFYKVRGCSEHIFRNPELIQGKNLRDLKSKRKILPPVKIKIKQMRGQPENQAANIEDIQNKGTQEKSSYNWFCWQFQPYFVLFQPSYTSQIVYYQPQYYQNSIQYS